VDWASVRGHGLVLIAIAAGILGMGLVFNGVSHGSVGEVGRGAPFLLMGLWWAGRELGRNMLMHRRTEDRGEG
jgi:hypothetical protein